MEHTPDPNWHVRRYEPTPTRWVGAPRWWDDERDTERAGCDVSERARATTSPREPEQQTSNH